MLILLWPYSSLAFAYNFKSLGGVLILDNVETSYVTRNILPKSSFLGLLDSLAFLDKCSLKKILLPCKLFTKSSFKRLKMISHISKQTQTYQFLTRNFISTKELLSLNFVFLARSSNLYLDFNFLRNIILLEFFSSSGKNRFKDKNISDKLAVCL